MKEISAKELKQLQKQGASFQLIDVREPWEREISQIGGISIPMHEIESKHTLIDSNKQVIIHCYKGSRSAEVIGILERTYKMDNLYNLTGGLLAYAKEVDPSLTIY